ncbi:MAG: GNAT family N-acetyltransferase [Methylophilaceae bacterium]
MSELTLRWVNSESEIPAELWEACFPAPFEGHWWYQALEHCGIEDQFTFIYGLVLENERPVAIAPAFLMDVPIRLVVPPALLPIFNVLGKVMPSALYQRTLFIGSPCSDEGRVGMVQGVDRLAVLRCVNDALLAKSKEFKAPMRVWKDFPAEYDQELTTIAKEAKLFRLVSFPGAEAHIGGSKDAYLASLKSSRRNKLKKKLKQAANAPVNVEIVQQPSTEVMDELFGLFWQTYEKGTTKFERLNRKFFDLISAHPHAYYVVLRSRENGKVLAFMLCFALGKHVINKFIGIDYSQPKEWFLYFRLWEAAVEWSASMGAESIQSGQTGYAPKVELGHDMVTLTNYCTHTNPLVHWIFATVAKTINWDTLDEDLAEYVKAYPELRPKSA